MTDDNLHGTIRRFLIEAFAPDQRPEELTDDLNLIQSGILDSLALVETATFLEDLAGAEIESHQLTPDNIGSIAAMSAFVRRLRTAEA